MNNELLAAGYEESGDRATNGLRQEADGVPNKPMVLTALTTTEEPAISSVRQHIGEPLGRQRATHDGPRFTAETQRAQRREQFQRRQRATSGSARIGPTRHVQRTTQWRVASGE